MSPDQSRQQIALLKSPGSAAAMIFSWKSLGASEENESLRAGKTRNPQTQHYQENLGKRPKVQQQFLGWKDLAGKD